MRRTCNQDSPYATLPDRCSKGEHEKSGYVCRGLSGIFSDGGSTPPASTTRRRPKGAMARCRDVAEGEVGLY